MILDIAQQNDKINFRISQNEKDALQNFIEEYNQQNNANLNMTKFIRYAIKEQIKREKKKLK